jgi:hypothetical protein
MDAPATSKAASGLAAHLENMIVGSVRLSSAAALFTFSQIESTYSELQEGATFADQLKRLGAAADSLSQCLLAEISPGKHEALDALSEITSRVVQQTLGGLGLFDPRHAVNLATRMARQSSSIFSGRDDEAGVPLQETPQLAVDVLVN